MGKMSEVQRETHCADTSCAECPMRVECKDAYRAEQIGIGLLCAAVLCRVLLAGASLLILATLKWPESSMLFAVVKNTAICAAALTVLGGTTIVGRISLAVIACEEVMSTDNAYGYNSTKVTFTANVCLCGLLLIAEPYWSI